MYNGLTGSETSILQGILEEMIRTRRLRVSRRATNNLIKDFRLVLHGVRTAYLIDSVDFPEDLLIDYLREVMSIFSDPLYGQLRILQDVSNMQVYIINLDLLRESLSPENIHSWVQYCCIGQQGYELVDRLEETDRVLEKLAASLISEPDRISIPLEEVQPNIGVALAGFLLEYPIAYFPPSQGCNSLGGVPLRVYESILADSHHPERRLPLMKFSCPAALSSDLEAVLGSSISDAIQSRFVPRLGILSSSELTDLTTQVSNVTLDVVVL